MELSPTALAYDSFLFDLDGCLWVGEQAVEDAADALNALRTAGKGIVFITNDPRHGAEQYVRTLWRLGFQAAIDEVVTVGAALQSVLADSLVPRSAFVVGSPALIDHVARAGMTIVNRTERAAHADLVVVAGHEQFDYAELRTAVQAVRRGGQLVGTTRDATFPMPDGPWPGSGAVLAAVEAGAGRSADLIVGKPEPAMYAAALDRLGPGRVLAVGDRLDMDVAGAQRAGLDSALVLTGASTVEELDAVAERPTFVAASVSTLLAGAESSVSAAQGEWTA